MIDTDSLFILFLMVFLHIVDDFYLQRWLASAKQKEWWEKNAPEVFYTYDYAAALAIHSFSWAFMIMLPIATTIHQTPWFFIVFACNMVIHAAVDDLKANKKKINLCLDQSIHLIQILLTHVIFF